MKTPWNSPKERRVGMTLLITACTLYTLTLYQSLSESALLYISVMMEPTEEDAERMINTCVLGKDDGYRLINNLAESGRLDFRRVARYPLPDSWLTPMDQELLKDDPVKDLTTIAVAETSTITLLTDPPRGQDKGMVGVGGRMEVRVDLKDAEGRQVKKGDHSVRVWLEQQAEGQLYRAMAADVTDLRNGSYVASLPVLWRGQAEVKAALERPREFQQQMLRLMNKMKLIAQNPAVFSFQQTEQVTLCSFVPVVPGFPEVCNLTEANSGLPWFCGKPTKAGLLCEHWAWSKHTSFPLWYPASLEENRLIKRFTGKTAIPLHVLPNAVVFYGLGGEKPVSVANDSCTPLQPFASWTDQSPRGFWQNGTWHPLIGCPLPSLDSTYVRRCFQNTRLLFLGDSNAALMYLTLESLLGCVRKPDPQEEYHRNTGHIPIHSATPPGDEQRNTTMAWFAHAYPFYSGQNVWSDVRVKRAPGAVLGDEPGASAGAKKYVVLIHLYAHYSPVHSFVYAQHVRHTASAVRAFLRRNPEAKVLVRGPHAVLGKNFRMAGDHHAARCLAILRREFWHLRDRVTLLNPWDMTVANRNEDVHPEDAVTRTLVSMMIAHACPSQTERSEWPSS